MNIDNQTDITNNIQNNYLTNEIADNNNIGTNIPHSLPLNSSNYEYVTKGRKTLYNSTHLNLESPKKQNPSRSKRLSLLNKGNKDSNMYNKNIELFSFGKEMFNSNKKLRKKNNEQSKSLNLNYKLLIKRIAAQLRKRVKLPTCKIIKVYQPYRELILRIARGIKKTSKKYNNKEINKDNDSGKYGVSLILKEENNKSKQKEINLQPKERKEQEDNINYLLSIDDTSQNINFINDFEKFIEINNIEISDTKIPSFKNENNKYLLTNLFFWIKFIKYICQKFKNNLSFFNFMNFVEVFYNWIDMDKYDLNIFNKLIIEQMELAFDKVAINNFLLIHKLKSIDELFLRYKIMNNFKEAKKRENCQCPSCQNIKQQVINYNKKNTFISYSEENNFNYVNKVIKFPETKTIFDDKYIGLSIDNLNNNNNNDNEFKNNIIPEFFRWSREIKQPKNIIPEKILQYNDDKKITDFFVYTKIQRSAKKAKEKKEDEKSANKSIKKSVNKSSSKKKKKNKSISNEKKRKKSGVKNNKKGKKRSHYSTKEIFELINMEE